MNIKNIDFPLAFKPVIAENDNCKILCLRRPPNEEDWLKYKNEYSIIGISSNRGFPKKCPNYAKSCFGWCHCFRDPDNYIPIEVPKALISESDFINYDKIKPYNVDKKYDFAYTCLKTQSEPKNYKLFLKSLPILVDQMNLKGLVIGRRCKYNNIDCIGLTSRKQFFRFISSARFLFLPNKYDASPRILTESLCLDIPVVVNEEILGGWKYVSSQSGFFFSDDLVNLSEAIEKVLDSKMSPRDHFAGLYGPQKTGWKLRESLQKWEIKVKNTPYMISPY